MTQPLAPQSQWNDRAATIVPTLTRVYMTTTAGGRSTFSSGGPSTAELVENASSRWEASAVLTGQRLAQDGNNRLLTF